MRVGQQVQVRNADGQVDGAPLQVVLRADLLQPVDQDGALPVLDIRVAVQLEVPQVAVTFVKPHFERVLLIFAFDFGPE